MHLHQLATLNFFNKKTIQTTPSSMRKDGKGKHRTCAPLIKVIFHRSLVTKHSTECNFLMTLLFFCPVETSRELNICETADDYWAAYDRDSQVSKWRYNHICRVPKELVVI